MQWSLSEDSWERGSRFYTHIINRINKFESQIEDLYEDENKKEEKIRKNSIRIAPIRTYSEHSDTCPVVRAHKALCARYYWGHS